MKFNPNKYKWVNKEGMKRQFERTQEKTVERAASRNTVRGQASKYMKISN